MDSSTSEDIKPTVKYHSHLKYTTFTSSFTRIFEILFSIFVKSHEKHLWYLSLKLDSAVGKIIFLIKYSVICIYQFAFKLEFIKKMSLAGALFESNQSFQFEVFLRDA